MESLQAVLQQAVESREVPSLSLNVRVDGREVFHRSLGLARLDPPRPVTDDQPYDLASVTKVLCGAAVTASLLEDGTLALDTPAAAHVPGVDPRITVAHLLTHSSGYPAWRPLYEGSESRPLHEGVRGTWGTAATRQALLEAARSTPLRAEPGAVHCYSDLGYLVLLQVLEAAAGRPLAVLFQERVCAPAGIEDLRWGWPNAAATERCPVRQVVVEGTVHDLNTAALGGVSTHAGLFGTARAVAGLACHLMQAALDPQAHPRLPGRAIARLWALRGPGSHRGGWDGLSEGYTSTGAFFPHDSVGHLGYTGTSVWVAPSRRTVVALLTNRVHPVDDKEPIRALRPRVHDAVARALGWAVDPG